MVDNASDRRHRGRPRGGGHDHAADGAPADARTPAERAGSTPASRGAIERGADLVWLMDDDGTPAAGLPAVLLPHLDDRTTSSGRPSCPRTTPAGCASRSGCRAARRSLHAVADLERAAAVGPARGRRDPVQRRAGHPRAGRADRPAARGVLHLGRRRRVPLACAGGGCPHRHRRRLPVPAPVDRRPRHPADVRPDDVQPLAVGPEALLHVPQQRGQPASPPRPRSGSSRSW